MSFAAIITTIQAPTPAVRAWSDLLGTYNARLIVAGDKKGPAAYDVPHTTFLSLSTQLEMPFALAKLLPTGHYTRKNLAYLAAIRDKAPAIFETDDDNAPLPNWRPRTIRTTATPATPDPRTAPWHNAYTEFSDKPVWPRGYPLRYIVQSLDKTSPRATGAPRELACPIQQSLANGSPDVDAVWRLTQDRDFDFAPATPSVLLPAGLYCPFNSQATWWFEPAYPLLYLPSTCTFRMTDIWRSFIAQRCLWELSADSALVFHEADVVQARNPHDLMRDFADEVPGYLHNERIIQILGGLELKKGPSHVADNLLACYRALIAQQIFRAEEMPMVEAWVAGLT